MTGEQRTAIVTGAGSGLGRAMALELASDGLSVLVTDMRLEAAEETVALMPARHGSHAICLDVSCRNSLRRFADRIEDLAIELLINNAGLQYVAPLEEFPPEKWNHLIDVMLNGSFAMTQLALPSMRRVGHGRIVNIGSIHSCIASPFKSAYVAAKHGLLGLSKVVALETADVDVTINTICPSYIQTPLVDSQIKDQAIAHGIPPEEVVTKILLEPMPKKAFITYEEVIATIRFLMAPQARNITGQTIVIDGGWTLR